MANRGLFTYLIVFLGLGILFAGAFNVGYGNAQQDYFVENESITVDYTDTVPVAVQGENVDYSDTVEVYNSTGVELVNGTDYVWLQDDGAVDWQDTNATTSGGTATINYTYYEPPEVNRTIADIMNPVGYVLVLIVFLLAAQWVFGVVGDW